MSELNSTTAHESFELLEEIGRGEVTVVHRAYDLNLGRDVAIKHLNRESAANQQLLDGFLAEARFLAQFDHPAILRIHSVEPKQGWVVMDLMKGSLQSRIQQGPVSPDTVHSVLCQLLPALEFLHDQGKVHASIRPSNILIDDEGRVKLSDFEANNYDGELRAPTGSTKYLAPELVRADLGTVGSATDLYCLGLTALEMLVGPQFSGRILSGLSEQVDANIAWLRWHGNDVAFPPAERLAKRVPPDLAAVVDSMVKKDVSQRPDSAAEALARLGQHPIVPVAIPDSSDDRLDSHNQEQASMLPAGVIASNIYAPSVNEVEPPSGSKSPPRAKAEAGNIRNRINRAIERPAVLYPLCAGILLVALAIGFAMQSGDEPPELLAHSEAANHENESSGEQIIASDDLDGFQDDPVIEPIRIDDLGLAEKPAEVPLEEEPYEDAALVAEQGFDGVGDAADAGTVDDPLEVVLDTAGSEETPATSLPALDSSESLESHTVSPERAESGFVVAESESPEPLPVEPEPAGPAPVLPRLEFVSTKVDVRELVTEFKDAPELVIDSGGFISEIADVAISPDGHLLAAAGAKEVRIWEIASGALLHCLRGDRARTSYGNCNALAFSPDNQFLLVGVSDYAAHGNIRVYRTDDFDRIEALLPGHTAPISKLCFSRDAAWMASADSDGNVAVWDWATRTLLRKIGPRDPKQPIVDELHFPGEEPVLVGVDFQGPFLLSVPDLTRLSGQDQLPPRTLAWIYDILTRQLEYPFSSTDDPRNLDLKLESGKWSAAGIAEHDGRNRFWVGIWDARTMEQAVQARPGTLYAKHRWSITAVAIEPAHNLAASGDKFGEIHLWDASTGEQKAVFRGQGKPIYEAAYDGGPRRIAFGTRPHAPDQWRRNDYGKATQVIDLGLRAIYDRNSNAERPSGDTKPLAGLPTEIVAQGGARLRVMGTEGQANLRLEKTVAGRPKQAYQFTTGRNPTAFSFLGRPIPGVAEPVLVGDNVGLFAVWDSARDELSRAYIGHDSLISSICPSPDGSLVLSASTDRTMRIWPLDEATPTGRFDFRFENSVVTEVLPETSSARAGVKIGDKVLDIDGLSITDMHRKMLDGDYDYRPGQTVPVTMSRDGRKYDFNMMLTEGYDFADPVLNIFIGDDDRWIIWTPAGYYDASPGAEQLIGWHVNRGPDKAAAFYRVQQFREELYRPDIINLILAGTLPEQAAREANSVRGEAEVDFRSPSDLALHHPPEVEFVAPQAGESLNSQDVRLVATVRSRNGLPISEATVLVNGISRQVLRPTDSAAQEMKIDLPLKLASGRNDLEIIASNEKATSFAQSIYVYAAPKPTEQSNAPETVNLNVLAIGISEYQAASQFSNLPLASSDADVFAETASTQSGGRLYGEVRSRVLTNSEATRAGILDGLQWLIDQTEVGDTVAIFISAHGFVDSTDNFYLGTHDVDIARPRSTAIAWREFTKTLHADLPSCQRLLFLDLHPTQQAVSSKVRNPLLDLAAPEMATVFFSSNSLQQSELPGPTGTVGFSAAGLAKVLADPGSDVQPDEPDALLNAEEVSQAWLDTVREMARQQFYPVAFTPAKAKHQDVFELAPGQ